MKNMSQRKVQIVAAIEEYTDKHGYPPSVRELAVLVGLRSESTTHRHLEDLKTMGIVTWEPSRPRTLTIVKGELFAT